MGYNKIDFEKIKLDAIEVKKQITLAHKKRNKLIGVMSLFILAGLYIYSIVLIVTDASMATSFSGVILILLTLMLQFWLGKRKKMAAINNLPESLPNELKEKCKQILLYEIKKEEEASLYGIELQLYKNQVVIQTGETLNNVKYEVMGYLSGKSEEDILEKAYGMQADVVTGFESSTSVSNNVESSLTGRHISTSTSVHEKCVATAVKILDLVDVKVDSEHGDNSKDNNMSSELKIIAQLKKEGALTDEEYSKAKAKILT